MRGPGLSHPALVCPFLGMPNSSFSVIFLFFTLSSFLPDSRSPLPLLLRLRFPHFLSSFSEHFLLLPIIFSPLSTLTFPQIIAYMRAPLSSCSSGCIFCKNHSETSKPLGLFISCETPPPSPPPPGPVWGGTSTPFNPSGCKA